MYARVTRDVVTGPTKSNRSSLSVSVRLSRAAATVRVEKRGRTVHYSFIRGSPALHRRTGARRVVRTRAECHKICICFIILNSRNHYGFYDSKTKARRPSVGTVRLFAGELLLSQERRNAVVNCALFPFAHVSARAHVRAIFLIYNVGAAEGLSCFRVWKPIAVR